jgi:hypothetical protein
MATFSTFLEVRRAGAAHKHPRDLNIVIAYHEDPEGAPNAIGRMNLYFLSERLLLTNQSLLNARARNEKRHPEAPYLVFITADPDTTYDPPCAGTAFTAGKRSISSGQSLRYGSMPQVFVAQTLAHSAWHRPYRQGPQRGSDLRSRAQRGGDVRRHSRPQQQQHRLHLRADRIRFITKTAISRITSSVALISQLFL